VTTFFALIFKLFPRRTVAVGVAAWLSLAAFTPVLAQISQREDVTHNSLQVRRAFAPAVEPVVDSVVTVIVGGTQVALGVIVSPDGCILTKASELRGPITVRTRNGPPMPARILGCVLEHDLAMLKIDADGLRPVAFDATGDPPVGQWVATVGPMPTPIAVGVISVGRRSIFAGVVMGVMLDNYDGRGARVATVSPGSGAAAGGMLKDDVIVRIDNAEIKARSDVTAELARKAPGQRLAITVMRDGAEVPLTITVAKRPSPTTRTVRQNRMGGRLSDRRDGFPAVLQHDMVSIEPRDCGSPIVTLDGKVVGLNIARAGRTEVYALPAEILAELIPQLRDGKFPPTTNPSVADPELAGGDRPKSESSEPSTAPSPER